MNGKFGQERIVYLNDFYQIFCLRLGLEKPVLRKVLLQLEKEDAVQINWHSPAGAHLIVKRKEAKK